jgi:hypothetical protein
MITAVPCRLIVYVLHIVRRNNNLVSHILLAGALFHNVQHNESAAK